jgi:hypothetical protein
MTKNGSKPAISEASPSLPKVLKRLFVIIANTMEAWHLSSGRSLKAVSHLHKKASRMRSLILLWLMTKFVSTYYVTHYFPFILILIHFQSLNVIECPELRSIFLMLREELQDSDIPHRATIRRRIMQLWEEQLNRVADEMAVCSQYRTRTLPLLILVLTSGCSRKNLIYHRYMDRKQFDPLYGRHRTLDSSHQS